MLFFYYYYYLKGGRSGSDRHGVDGRLMDMLMNETLFLCCCYVLLSM